MRPISVNVSINVSFQLPLSGSPGSFTNLSTIKSQSSNLSTPSLGITKACPQIHIQQLYLFLFQLPLSGSPSPIPGFSGSPRLSAAAPPSHICIFRPLFEDITATKHHDSNRRFKRNSRCTSVIWCTMEPATSCGQPLYPRSWPESGTRLLITHRRQRAG